VSDTALGADAGAAPIAPASGSSSGSKRSFNISRWALEHRALTRYLLVVLLVRPAGLLGKET